MVQIGANEFLLAFSVQFRPRLPDRDVLLDELKKMAERDFRMRAMGGWKVAEYSRRDEYTAFLPLAQSSIVAHSYPEREVVTVQITSCAPDFPFEAAEGLVRQRIEALGGKVFAFYPVPLPLVEK